jgi:hypothetical protein
MAGWLRTCVTAVIATPVASHGMVTRGDGAAQGEVDMDSECEEIPGPDPDRFTCTIEGKDLTIVFRNIALYGDDIDLSDIHPRGRVHAASIEHPDDARSAVSALVEKAVSGDLLALFCADAECRAMALAVLGIKDS